MFLSTVLLSINPSFRKEYFRKTYDTIMTDGYTHIRKKILKETLCFTSNSFLHNPTFYEGLIKTKDFCPHCYRKLTPIFKLYFKPLSFGRSPIVSRNKKK